MYIVNPHSKTSPSSAIVEKEEQVIFSSSHDRDVINWLEAHGLHASLIEDIQSKDQSISFDEIENSKLKIMKYILPNEEDRRRTLNYNVSILHFENKLFILSEEEKVISRIREVYLAHDDSRYNTAYLLYLFPDIIIDNNTSMLEQIEERLETLEDHIFHDRAKENVLHQDIYYMRRTLDKLLKITTQEKDSIRKGYDHLSKEEKNALQYEYLDIKEHIRFLIDESRALLDRSEYLLNLHTGILSTRMNKAMQRLAAISLIFLPLTFIAGVYGMNFINMPELKWEFGYAMVWIIYIVIAVIVFIKLRKMKWL
jgi:magnesium transporter